VRWQSSWLGPGTLAVLLFGLTLSSKILPYELNPTTINTNTPHVVGLKVQHTCCPPTRVLRVLGSYCTDAVVNIVATLKAFIFQITVTDTGEGALWAAERVPDDHVGAVMNGLQGAG
jgi:hypothetical protein